MQTVQVAGVQLAVTDEGAGPVVVLLHGFPLCRAMWDAQIPTLARRYRVLAPDLRGFGDSHAVSADSIGMEVHADDLNRLLDALRVDEPIRLCGFSMGGYIGWEFWRRHKARVGRLVLCDTRAAADAPQAAQARRETADRVLAEGVGVLADQMMPKLLAPETPARQPAVAEAVRRMIESADPRAIAAALRGMADRRDSTELLAQIDVPVLAIVGRHDAISTPDEMTGIIARLADARLAVIDQAGHMAPMENPAAVSDALLDFLS